MPPGNHSHLPNTRTCHSVAPVHLADCDYGVIGCQNHTAFLFSSQFASSINHRNCKINTAILVREKCSKEKKGKARKEKARREKNMEPNHLSNKSFSNIDAAFSSNLVSFGSLLIEWSSCNLFSASIKIFSSIVFSEISFVTKTSFV